MEGEHELQEYFSPDIFKAAFRRVCKTFLRDFQSVPTFPSVSKGFQRVSKRFERVSKGFQSVSKGFSKGFKVFPNGSKSVSKGFQKGFRVTSNPLKNAFVDKTCFRMEGHICQIFGRSELLFEKSQ